MNLIDKILLEAYITKAVKSSNLKKVAYDAKNETMKIFFHSGSVYEYYEVPKKVYAALMRAKSKGRYAYYNICWTYDYEQIG